MLLWFFDTLRFLAELVRGGFLRSMAVGLAYLAGLLALEMLLCETWEEEGTV